MAETHRTRIIYGDNIFTRLRTKLAFSEYTASRILSRPSRGYELSLITLLAKVGRLGAEKNSARLTDRRYVDLHIDACDNCLQVNDGHSR